MHEPTDHDADPQPENETSIPLTGGIDPEHKPLFDQPTGFDENGAIVPVTDHPRGETPPEPAEGDPLDSVRLDTIRAVLAFLGLGESNLKTIGWRVAMFTHLVFPSESQAALAKRLGVSSASLSTHLKAARMELAAFQRAISRQGDIESK
jgi:hypothetical protein